MADCCAELRAEVAALRAEIAKIKPTDEQSIIKKAVDQASLAVPGIAGSVIALKLAPVLVDVNNISRTATTALNTGSQALGKATSALGQLASLAASIAAVGLAIAALNTLGGRIDSVENGIDVLGNDLSRAYGLIQGVKNIATGADTKAIKAQTGVDDLYKYTGQLSSRIFSVESIANSGLSKANSALDSATEANRRIIIVANTANSAFTLSQENKSQIANQAIQLQTINTELSANSQAHAKFNSDIAQAQSKANQALSVGGEALATAKAIKPIAENAIASATAAKAKADKAEAEAAQALRETSNAIGTANVANAKAQEALTKIAITEGIARQAQAEAEAAIALGGAAIGAAANTAQGLNNLTGQLGGVRGTATGADAKANDALSRISNIKNGVVTDPAIQNAIAIPIGGVKQTQQKQQEQINQIQQKLGTPSNTSEVTRTEFEQIKQKLGEADRMNEAGNRKLDDILSKFPGLPAATAAAVSTRVPSLPQIKSTVGSAMCESAQSGCVAGALNNQTNNLSNDFGQKLRDLEQGLNAGANAAQLTLLNTINLKLGAEVVGGISGSLGRFYEWAHIDRALNLLTFAASVHNGMMLSNDIAQTLSQALGNVLTLIGIKDKDGNALNVSSLIGTSIENAIKGVIGAENYAELSANFAKANRIYQASTNVLNSFLNVSQTVLQASEMIASHTGKIGNALKKGGVLLESAYGWMNPQPKFNRITSFLEGFQNTASTIAMVTQTPLDILNATTEFNNSATAFVTAIKEDDKPANKAPAIPDPDVLKAQEALSKINSQPANFDLSDLFDGED